MGVISRELYISLGEEGGFKTYRDLQIWHLTDLNVFRVVVQKGVYLKGRKRIKSTHILGEFSIVTEAEECARKQGDKFENSMFFCVGNPLDDIILGEEELDLSQPGVKKPKPPTVKKRRTRWGSAIKGNK